MGDRCDVEVIVLKLHKKKVNEIFDKYADFSLARHPTASPIGIVDDSDLICFYFDAVNYGQLDFLQEFPNKGIPYDYNWGQGDEYDPGNGYCRYLEDGTVFERVISAEDINPPFASLVELIDKPFALAEYVKNHANWMKIPSWKDQDKYADKFRTLQLIGAK
jgi:hypothetical protein